MEAIKLTDIPGFPACEMLGSTWTLGQLEDRMNMIAQFTVPRPTLEEAMLDAFGAFEASQAVQESWDDDMKEYYAKTNANAKAAFDAVMKYLAEMGVLEVA